MLFTSLGQHGASQSRLASDCQRRRNHLSDVRVGGARPHRLGKYLIEKTEADFFSLFYVNKIIEAKTE